MRNVFFNVVFCRRSASENAHRTRFTRATITRFSLSFWELKWQRFGDVLEGRVKLRERLGRVEVNYGLVNKVLKLLEHRTKTIQYKSALKTGTHSAPPSTTVQCSFSPSTKNTFAVGFDRCFTLLPADHSLHYQLSIALRRCVIPAHVPEKVRMPSTFFAHVCIICFWLFGWDVFWRGIEEWLDGGIGVKITLRYCMHNGMFVQWLRGYGMCRKKKVN